MQKEWQSTHGGGMLWEEINCFGLHISTKGPIIIRYWPSLSGTRRIRVGGILILQTRMEISWDHSDFRLIPIPDACGFFTIPLAEVRYRPTRWFSCGQSGGHNMLGTEPYPWYMLCLPGTILKSWASQLSGFQVKKQKKQISTCWRS